MPTSGDFEVDSSRVRPRVAQYLIRYSNERELKGKKVTQKYTVIRHNSEIREIQSAEIRLFFLKFYAFGISYNDEHFITTSFASNFT